MLELFYILIHKKTNKKIGNKSKFKNENMVNILSFFIEIYVHPVWFLMATSLFGTSQAILLKLWDHFRTTLGHF